MEDIEKPQGEKKSEANVHQCTGREWMEGQGRTGYTNQNDQKQEGEHVSRKIHMVREKVQNVRRNNFSKNMTETLKQSWVVDHYWQK